MGRINEYDQADMNVINPQPHFVTHPNDPTIPAPTLHQQSPTNPGITWKLQLWSVDAQGNVDELHDEVDVADDEWDYAQQDEEAAIVLLSSLMKGRMLP